MQWQCWDFWEGEMDIYIVFLENGIFGFFFLLKKKNDNLKFLIFFF